MSDILELRQPVETGDDEGPHTAPPPFPGEKWRIRIGDEEYGPYPRSRLIEFLKEGRVEPSGLVACGTETEFQRADCHPELSRVFKGPKKQKLGNPPVEPGDVVGPQIAPPPFESVKWRIRLGDKEYGPYSRTRLIDFLKEGRVQAGSFIACGTDTEYHRADCHPNLRWDFKGPKKRKFGDPRIEAGETEVPVCNYFIAARLVSGNDRFERVLREAGKMTRAAGDMWVLRSRQTIQQLRTLLTLAVKPHEHFIIVNASKDRLAWYNIGVENDISVRGVWDADELQ